MTRRRQIRLAVATWALLGAVTAASAGRGKRTIEVHDHRGARALRPENTIAAFDHALALGVDVLELDLGVTVDDQVVVLHDQTVNRERCRDTRGKPPRADLAVRSLTLAQLQSFDCGSQRHPRFPRQQPVPGARIPTLEQVLSLVQRSRHPAARRVQLNLETKIVPGLPALAPTPRHFVKLVVKLLTRHKLLRRSMLQSFDHRTLRAAARLAPGLRRVALIGQSRPDLVAVSRAARARTVSPHHRWITAGDVKRAHRAGIRVVPWTANRPADWTRLIKLGVDGIITDDPAALILYLKRQGLR